MGEWELSYFPILKMKENNFLLAIEGSIICSRRIIFLRPQRRKKMKRQFYKKEDEIWQYIKVPIVLRF